MAGCNLDSCSCFCYSARIQFSLRHGRQEKTNGPRVHLLGVGVVTLLIVVWAAVDVAKHGNMKDGVVTRTMAEAQSAAAETPASEAYRQLSLYVVPLADAIQGNGGFVEPIPGPSERQPANYVLPVYDGGAPRSVPSDRLAYSQYLLVKYWGTDQIKLIYTERWPDGRPLTDKDGNRYILVSIHREPHTLPPTGN